MERGHYQYTEDNLSNTALKVSEVIKAEFVAVPKPKTHIEEYTRAEILVLPEDKIDFLIRYRCAELGIVYLPKPDEPKAPVLPEKTEVVYEVMNIQTRSKAIAEELEALLQRAAPTLVNLDYKWDSGLDSGIRYVKALTEHYLNRITVTRNLGYTEEQYQSLIPEFKAYKEATESYKKKLDEYEANHEARLQVENEIYDYISDIIRDERELNLHRAKFQEYLELAGDRETAKKFFHKAYKPKLHHLQELFPEDYEPKCEPMIGETDESTE